jgi:hypothetical protein
MTFSIIMPVSTIAPCIDALELLSQQISSVFDWMQVTVCNIVVLSPCCQVWLVQPDTKECQATMGSNA